MAKMAKMITVRRARKEIKRLQHYIDLAESYEADTLEKLIIKEYSYSNSIAEVVRVLDRRGIQLNSQPIGKEYVTNVINGKVTDELHRILKSGYLRLTKHSRSNKTGSNFTY